MGVFCLKGGKWGCFGKKVDLSSTQGALCTASVFFILHFTYWGGAYAPNAPRCLRAWGLTLSEAAELRGAGDEL